MSTDLDRIRAYYSRFSEWERLTSASGALEFRRACALLQAHLQTAGRVLDLGGGPGRYAIELARRGHRVVLADASPILLEEARRRLADAGVMNAVDSIDEVDARDLGRYEDHAFDAVVAFGPLYHLVSAGERATAVREIERVLRPQGLAFAAFIPRLSGLAGLLERAANTPEQVPPAALTRALDTGVFRNGSESGFQEGYYAEPLEVGALFESAGFEVVEFVSLRSVANLLEDKLALVREPVRAEMECVLDRVSRDPAVVATAGHAVLVARRS
jgi:ubiquinone/menaquinone biosynthesis C-methylase UbiE